MLYPERSNRPHVVDTLHRCLPTLLQLLLVLGGPAGLESDLQEAESPEDRETQDEDEGEFPGGGERDDDCCQETHNRLEQNPQFQSCGLQGDVQIEMVTSPLWFY